MGEQEDFQQDPQKNDLNTTDSADETEETNNQGENVEISNSESFDEDYTEENIGDEAFQNLDHQLDALFVALDEIESKNDNLHAQLLQLLHSNREIRKELQEAHQVNGNDDRMDTENP
ncbi:UPF0184 protein C9orf16 homolog [Sitophilus oryzae]|uniref:UPF0184 protein C9orf16 homolog n=1 Tax=Sitophilus oryzae TaxID=7048 RepID=A0A6J2XAD9_SITOR|nr:UPF0184 protein C9orf16 homolog [Sitophilus oryzae]